MTTRATTPVRNLIVREIAADIDAAPTPGVLEIYAGRMPPSVDDQIRIDPIWGQQLLARLTFSRPAFGAPLNGLSRARPIEPTVAIASGRATWGRVYDGYRRPVMDIDVAEAGAALNLSSTEFEEGAAVAINEFVLRSPPLG